MRALDASLRGFRVLPMAQAAPLGEVFVTVTGSVDVINADHLAVMRDGAILANAGHFDVEIDVRALAGLAVAVHPDVRPHVDAYELADGRTLLLLAEGRVVNLVAAEGHPPEVMDLAFGIEALALAWLAGKCCTRATSSRPGCTRCPPTSTPRPRAWCSPPPARRSTRSPRRSWPTGNPGGSAPDRPLRPAAVRPAARPAPAP